MRTAYWLTLASFGFLGGCFDGVSLGSNDSHGVIGNDDDAGNGGTTGNTSGSGGVGGSGPVGSGGVGNGGSVSGSGNSGGGAGTSGPGDFCALAPETFAAECPGAIGLFMSPTGSPGGPALPSAPTSSFELVRSICAAQPCHVHLAEGTYTYDSEQPIMGPCVIVEGGLVPNSEPSSDGTWAPGGGPSVIVQQFHLTPGPFGQALGLIGGGRIFVDRLTVQGGHTAVSAFGSDLMAVRDSTFSTDYGIVLANSNAARICNTKVNAGEVGVAVRFQSSNVVLENVTIDAVTAGVAIQDQSHGVLLQGVTIDAGEVGVAVAWGSSAVTLTDVVARSDEAALYVSQASSGVTATGSTLQGLERAAWLSQSSGVHLLNGRLIGATDGVIELESFQGPTDVRVIGNRVSGPLPPSDPERQIEIRDNIIE